MSQPASPSEVYLLWCNDTVLSVHGTRDKAIDAAKRFMIQRTSAQHWTDRWRLIPGDTWRWAEVGGDHIARLEVMSFPVE